MTYTSPGWVDVLPGTTAPPGAPALDAANLQLLTDAVAALSGGGLGGFTFVGPKTASYPPNPGEFVLWDTTSGSLVQTLPPAPADKTIIGAKIVVLGTGQTVTVNCAGADVFNKAGGGTSLVLTLVDQAVQLEYIAATSVWVITGIDLSLSQLDARYSGLYTPLPTGSPAIGKVPTVTATSPLALDWETPSGGTSALNERGAWATSTAYAIGDVVEQTGIRYACKTAHTSGTFATDLSASKWVETGADAAAYAPLASPALTGTPTAPTASGGTNTTQVATTAFVEGELTAKAAVLIPTAVKTGAYTAVAGDLVPVDTTSGAVTITLPNAPADKARVAVKHVIQGGTNAVTVNCAGSDVFNKTGGVTTASLSLVSQSIQVQYKATGAIWYVVADDLPLAQLDTRYGVLDATGSDIASDVTTGTPVAGSTGKGADAGHQHQLVTHDHSTTNKGGQLGLSALTATGTPGVGNFLRGDNTWSAPPFSRLLTVQPFAATVTPAVTSGVDSVYNIGTLTAAITIAVPTGTPVGGQRLEFWFKQDATGGRVVTLTTGANGFAYGTDYTAAMNPTTANAKWSVVTEWNSDDSRWRVVDIVRGF